MENKLISKSRNWIKGHFLQGMFYGLIFGISMGVSFGFILMGESWMMVIVFILVMIVLKGNDFLEESAYKQYNE